MLSSHDIRRELDGWLDIDPLTDSQIQPASVDLTLSRDLLYPAALLDIHEVVDPKRDNSAHDHRRVIDARVGFDMPPGRFLLASTEESVAMPSHLVARVEGRSSVGRLGLFVHVTAGFIDPGFTGQVTLELYNASGRYLRLYEGMPIAQLSFDYVGDSDTKAGINKLNGYTGKYQGQLGPQSSRIHRNWDAAAGEWR